MTAPQDLLDHYVAANRRRLADLDSLVLAPPRALEEGDTLVTPPGDGEPDALGLLRTRTRAADDPRAPWHPLTEHRLALLLRTDLDQTERTVAATRAVLEETERVLAATARGGDEETTYVVTISARDEHLVAPLQRHHLAPTTITALRRVSAAESLNPSYPIGVPAGVDLVGVDEVDREELLDAAVRASTTDVLQKRARLRPGTDEVLRRALDAQIDQGAELSSVARRQGRIIGLSIAGRVDGAEADRLDTGVRPMARCRLLWLDPSERGRGIAHSMLRHTHGRIAMAAVPWALSIFPATTPGSSYFWYREGYRPLTMQWHRTPAVSARGD